MGGGHWGPQSDGPQSDGPQSERRTPRVSELDGLLFPYPQDKYGYEGVVMVGDGATDMEARLEGAASLFIG